MDEKEKLKIFGYYDEAKRKERSILREARAGMEKETQDSRQKFEHNIKNIGKQFSEGKMFKKSNVRFGKGNNLMGTKKGVW